MKFGKSRKERQAATEERLKNNSPKRVFAFIPKYCYNTDREVWLEWVMKEEEYIENWDMWQTYYKEII